MYRSRPRALRHSLTFFAVVAGILLTQVWAADKTPHLRSPLTFNGAVTMALKQTPEMIKARARLAEAKGGVKQAHGHLLPRLSASFTATGSDDPLSVLGMKLSQGQATFNDFGASQFLGPQSLSVAPGNLDNPGWYQNYQTQLKLDIPVYNGGQAWSSLAQARASLAAAQQGSAAARQQLLFDVLKAYVGVDTARAFVGVSQKAVKASQAFVNLSQKLFKHGVVSKRDVLRSQLHLANARLREARAHNHLADQRTYLRILIGLPDDKPVQPSQKVQVNLPSGNLAQLRRQGVSANPDVQASLSQVQAAQAGVNKARAGYLPHFNIQISRAWNSPTLDMSHPSYTIAGVLSWNLFDFGSRGGAVDSAQARVMQRQAQARKAREQTEYAVDRSWRSVRLASLRIQARKQAISEARESERLARLRYEKGVTTIAELLNAQAELDKTRSQLVAARYQAVMARAGLLLAIGQLQMTDLQTTPANTGS